VRPADPGAAARIGHNGGPPLEHVPAWGRGGFGTFFHWRAARKTAFAAARDVAMLRLRNAERLGLSYEEYTLELIERGRHLGPADVEIVAAVKARRGR
jgi:hypothetical protein